MQYGCLLRPVLQLDTVGHVQYVLWATRVV